MKKFWKISISGPRGFEEQLTGAILELDTGGPVTEFMNDTVKVSFFLPSDFQGKERIVKKLETAVDPSCTVNQELVVDFWTERLHGDFYPLIAGRFHIVPAHLSDKTESVPELERITIIPGEAFGTGQHETTHMMLSFISRMAMKGKKVLDIGCGSGILSFAADLSGADSVSGFDIDPVAVANANENLDLNRTSNISFMHGRTENFTMKKWDIVLANMITGRLLQIRQPLLEINNFCKPVFVFSGIGVEHEMEFRKSFDFINFYARDVAGEWVLLSGQENA